MKEKEDERLQTPKFLQQLVNTNFQKCADDELVELAVRAKVIVSVYTSQEWMTPFEQTMVKGFQHYLEQMDDELEKRSIVLVDVRELIDGHKAEIAEVLKKCNLLYLMRLAEELETVTQMPGEHGSFHTLKDLVYTEIAGRSGSDIGS